MSKTRDFDVNDPDECYNYSLTEYKIHKLVEQELKKTGFKVLPLPGDVEPKSPIGVDSMSDTELGDLFDLHGQWYDYLSCQISLLDAYVEATSARKRATVAFLRQHAVPDVAKQDRDDFVELHPDYVDAHQDHMKLQAELRAQKVRLERFNKTLSRLSRHIALRSEGTRIVGRGHNIHGKRKKLYGTRRVKD